MEFKDLYQIAKTQLNDIIKSENPDFRLEQAEYKKEDDIWEIVVSYLEINTNKGTSPIAILGQIYPYERIFKRVLISGKKEVLGFYIYEP